MAKAKRARRNSVRTMDTDPEALSMLERLEQLEADQKAAAPTQDESPTPDGEDDAS